MKSVLDALSDMDSLKAGPLEFKRRKAINKVVKDIDIVASKSVSFSGNITASSSVTGSLSSEPKLLSVRIQQLEKENANLKIMLFGMSAVAAYSTRPAYPKVAEAIDKIADPLYKEVFATDPKSEILKSSSKLLTIEDVKMGDKIGVGEDIKVEVVGPDDVNTPDEIPPEESQQSKPPKKSKGSKMSDEQTTTSNEFRHRVIGFLSGSEDKQKKQISRIQDFFRDEGITSKTGNTAETGIEFVSEEWYKINNDLESGDYIIIDDLTDLSGNLEELVARLRVPLNKGVKVEPVNKEHWKLLKWDARLENIEKKRVPEERTLLGLKDDLAKIYTPKLK